MRYFAQPRFAPWFERWRSEHHVGQPWQSLYGLTTRWFEEQAASGADLPGTRVDEEKKTKGA